MAFVYWIHKKEHTSFHTQGYVGITSTSMERRMRGHKNNANYEKYNNTPLARAINKYGWDSLLKDIIYEGELSMCLQIEKALRPRQSLGCNLAIGGDKPTLGTKHSAETLMKMSEARKGIPVNRSEEHSLNLRLAVQKYAEDRGWWEVNPSISSVYAKEADLFQTIYSRNPEISTESVCTMLNLEFNFNWTNLLSRIRKGWNPLEDSKWIEEFGSRDLSTYQSMPLQVNYGQLPWNNNKADKPVWLEAQRLYDVWNRGKSLQSISRKETGSDQKYKSFLKHFRAGFNPHTNKDYLKWKEEYVARSK